jgi:hypothetical protein
MVALRAVAVVEARILYLCLETTAMMLLGIALSVFAIGLLCWLLFTLAIYALPFAMGMTAAFAVYHHGSGLMSSIIIGLFGAGATLAVGSFGLVVTRSLIARTCIALLFAIPATVAGYYATLGVAHIAIESVMLSDILAVLGALLVGGTAWTHAGAYASQAAASKCTSCDATGSTAAPVARN